MVKVVEPEPVAEVEPQAVAQPKPAPLRRRSPKQTEEAEQGAAEEEEAAAAGEELPQIDVGAPQIEASVARPSPATDPATLRKKKSTTTWLVAGGISAGALLVLLAVIVLVNALGRQSETAQPAADNGYLVLDWPVAERADSRVYIDGVAKPVRSSGRLRYELKPGEYDVVIKRKDFEQVEFSAVSIRAGEAYRVKPEWERMFAAMVETGDFPKPGEGTFPKPQPEPTFDDWLQDFEAAKTKAAKENKDILIAFDGSDWCPPSMRLAEEVFFQPEFRRQVDTGYVLVLVDFPKKPQAKARVKDPERNKALAEHFGVRAYPRIVLTDAQGRPFGFQGYVPGGVEEFVRALADWQTVRAQRDEVLLEVETLEDENKLKKIKRAVALLEYYRLLPYYEPTLNEWLQAAEKLDPANAKGDLEAVFGAVWLARLFIAEKKDENKRVAEIVQQLDEWKKKHKFRDRDRAAGLHAHAARALVMAEQGSAASKYIENGLAYKPTDPDVRRQLEWCARATKGIAAGTGFVIAADGYVLTNHHVIAAPGKTFVQLTPDEKVRVPAKVIAKDEEGDMALLKVEVPKEIDLKPISISTAEVRRGARVGAFGYPGGGAVGSGLKLTGGFVSSLPGQTPDGMLLLDCRVNPGNSGGPLCDSHGNVVGMVTAKSLSTFDTESYGMALPAANLKKFLAKHLPKDCPLPAAATSTKRLEWDEIDRMVGGSVLMIVKRL